MAIRTALLTNMMPPYRVKLLTALRNRVGELKIFISTEMENDRPWAVDNGSLDVIRQKSITFHRTRQHPGGFPQQLHIHFPYDTLVKLWRYSPDVVISSELGLRTLQAAIYRILAPRSRLLIWATLSEETERGWGIARQLLRRFILKIADGVICNGPSGARYIASFGFSPDRIFVVNQPIDVELFENLPLTKGPENARRIVFSGRLIAAKAVLELQDAVARWARENPSHNIELVWVGDGLLRGQLEALEPPANFSQTFLGNQLYGALPEIYGNCGALVLPSLMDEWGLVINEAMTSGLVVLGSVYSQAAVEMIRDGVTGWMIDPLRPETIGAALDKLFSMPLEALAEMRAAARKRALTITPDSAADHLFTAVKVVTQDKLGAALLHQKVDPARATGARTTAAATPADHVR